MKKLKKLFSVLLVLAVFLSSVQCVVSAQSSDTVITVDKVYGSPESTVDVNVTIENNPGILGAILSFTYDNEALKLINAVSGDAFSTLVMSKPGKFTSPCQFAWDGEYISEDQIEDGIILTLTFEITEKAVPGSNLDIGISYNRGDIVDGNLKVVNPQTVWGMIQVIDYTPGDVDGDKNINAKDLVLIRRYITGGYDVKINEFAADVNDDGKINTTDVILIRRYIAGGYGVKLRPSHGLHEHTMEEFEYTAPTCNKEGNIAYWHCTFCNNYYSDDEGTEEIKLADTVLEKSEEHTVVIDEAVTPTTTTTGLTEGSHCSSCGTVLVEQIVLPPYTGYAVTYNISNGDEYIATQNINIPLEKYQYSSEEGLELPNLDVKGYRFIGWSRSATSSDNIITHIEAGEKGNVNLYAHWELITYDITYKLYQTPLAPITDEAKLHYTVNKGLKDLPNPEIHNYVFLGWYTDDGKEVKEISVGTTDDITLNAHWTSKRNLTKKVNNMGEPIICEDTDNGVIYFAYEIGTIENVPVSDAVWTIQSVAGLSQQVSKEFKTSISTEKASQIAESISKATVDSSTWTLAENWNDSVSVNETWAEQNGMSQSEAETNAKTSSNTFSITNSNGGNNTTTTTDGTSALTYNSKNTTNEKGSHLDVSLEGKYTSELEVSLGGKFGLNVEKDGTGAGGEVNAGMKATNTIEIGVGAEGGKYKSETTNDHTGTDTTKIDTTVTAGTSTWNNSATSSSTQTASQSNTVSKALSHVISNTKGYGKTYSYGGSGSESQGISTTDSSSVNSSSSFTYFTSEETTTTTTYSTDGKHEGCYRLVIAGKIHVFGIVGYDVASRSYFTYSYGVLDDEIYEFLDYSPDLNFNDYENGALAFEIPYDVYEYVNRSTAATVGVKYITDSITGTATITDYVGTDTSVIVPSYISAGGKAYKVTSIEAGAFAGKNVTSVGLSDYITEIPDGAFKNCKALKQVSGRFTKIGSEAFSGCTELEDIHVSAAVTEIGADAFKGVKVITVKALDVRSALEEAKLLNPELDEENETDKAELTRIARELTQSVIDSAINSGAESVTLDISEITDGITLTLNVPAITYFELQGGGKTYKNLKLTSAAKTTSLRELIVTECDRIPLEISSDELELDAVSFEGTSFILLLSSENCTISLTRDNRFISSGEDCIVWNDPTIVSVDADNTVGVLYVNGNVYTCEENIIGISNMRQMSGELILITSEEFENYIKGSYKITLDANGGTVSTVDIIAYYGSEIGELPTPTRDYYTFEGWYTADGEPISPNSIIDEAVTLYAKWTQNAVSEWVLASEVPEDAEVIDRKWTYTLTENTTSTEASVEGWTQTSWEWQQTNAGTYYYGAFPDGFHTNNHFYCLYEKNALGGYENDSTKRTVSDSSFHTYIYYHWCRGNDSLNLSSNRSIEDYYESEYPVFDAFESVSEAGYSYYAPEDGKQIYQYHNASCCGDSYWYYRCVVYKQDYVEYQKLYSYEKQTEHESSEEVSETGSVSNVQQWVQYRAK